MSLTSEHFELAIAEIIGSDRGDKLAALHVLQREHARWKAEKNNQAWADGRRGDSVAKIPGLTETLTSLVRRFAACGVVRYQDMDDLHRHVSALRKKLKDMAPSVTIETMIGEGYEVTGGFDHLYRLLHAGKEPAMRAPGFTVKQTAILKHLAIRGSAHVDQIECLQRHMSNIRAAIKRQGLNKRIIITTHGGEGLYTVAKGKELIAQLVAGDLAPQPSAKPKAKAQAKPRATRKPASAPTLSLVAA